MTQHETRIKRHVVENVLASVVGGSVIAAVVQKSWLATLLAVVIGVLLYYQDKQDIEQEEAEQVVQEPVREMDGMQISDEVVAALRLRATRRVSVIRPEEIEIYKLGLRDGETITAQFVLGELTEEEDPTPNIPGNQG